MPALVKGALRGQSEIVTDRVKESCRAAVERRHEVALEEREALLLRREESLNVREAGLEKRDSVLMHREAMCRKRENSVRSRDLDALGYDKRNKRPARQLELQEEVVATKRRRVEEEEKTWDSAASKCSRNIA